MILVLFAHGAGAGSSHPWMRRYAAHLAPLGAVETFDYPYMQAHRKRPDALLRLIEAHRAALADARARHPDATRVVLAGKSMGSRVGCHLAVEEPVSALVCFGYPLVGASKRRPVRDAVLRALTTPILFVQGTRDPLCPLAQLEEVRAVMQAPSALHVVEGGDHSLEVGARERARRGLTQDAVDRAAVEAVRRFLDVA